MIFACSGRSDGLPRRLSRQEGLGHIHKLGRIATEGGGRPPFLGQAPATLFIGADQMGQAIAKTTLVSYKHQSVGWEMGMWLQRPFHFLRRRNPRKSK